MNPISFVLCHQRENRKWGPSGWLHLPTAQCKPFASAAYTPSAIPQQCSTTPSSAQNTPSHPFVSPTSLSVLPLTILERHRRIHHQSDITSQQQNNTNYFRSQHTTPLFEDPRVYHISIERRYRSVSRTVIRQLIETVTTQYLINDDEISHPFLQSTITRTKRLICDCARLYPTHSRHLKSRSGTASKHSFDTTL